jgi:hypothetical protein
MAKCAVSENEERFLAALGMTCSFLMGDKTLRFLRAGAKCAPSGCHLFICFAFGSSATGKMSGGSFAFCVSGGKMQRVRSPRGSGHAFVAKFAPQG